MGLVNRLIKIEEPSISVETFFSALREYARGSVTQLTIETTFVIESSDENWIAMLSSIASTSEKIARIDEMQDVFLIHENRDSRIIYPDATAVISRLGL